MSKKVKEIIFFILFFCFSMVFGYHYYEVYALDQSNELINDIPFSYDFVNYRWLLPDKHFTGNRTSTPGNNYISTSGWQDFTIDETFFIVSEDSVVFFNNGNSKSKFLRWDDYYLNYGEIQDNVFSMEFGFFGALFNSIINIFNTIIHHPIITEFFNLDVDGYSHVYNHIFSGTKDTQNFDSFQMPSLTYKYRITSSPATNTVSIYGSFNVVEPIEEDLIIDTYDTVYTSSDGNYSGSYYHMLTLGLEDYYGVDINGYIKRNHSAFDILYFRAVSQHKVIPRIKIMKNGTDEILDNQFPAFNPESLQDGGYETYYSSILPIDPYSGDALWITGESALNFIAQEFIKHEDLVYQFSHWSDQYHYNYGENRSRAIKIEKPIELYAVYNEPNPRQIVIYGIDKDEDPLGNWDTVAKLDGYPVEIWSNDGGGHLNTSSDIDFGTVLTGDHYSFPNVRIWMHISEPERWYAFDKSTIIAGDDTKYKFFAWKWENPYHFEPDFEREPADYSLTPTLRLEQQYKVVHGTEPEIINRPLEIESSSALIDQATYSFWTSNNTELTITAPEIEGYQFLHWKIDGENREDYNNPVYPHTLNAPIEFIAIYKPKITINTIPQQGNRINISPMDEQQFEFKYSNCCFSCELNQDYEIENQEDQPHLTIINTKFNDTDRVYRFVKWMDNPTLPARRSITVTEPATYTLFITPANRFKYVIFPESISSYVTSNYINPEDEYYNQYDENEEELEPLTYVFPDVLEVSNIKYKLNHFIVHYPENTEQIDDINIIQVERNQPTFIEVYYTEDKGFTNPSKRRFIFRP